MGQVHMPHDLYLVMSHIRATRRHVKIVANCFCYPYGAESLQGGTSPLWPAMFPVNASPVLLIPKIRGSATGASIGTGCWLGFAR